MDRFWNRARRRRGTEIKVEGIGTLRSAHKYVNAIQEDNEALKVVQPRSGSCVPANSSSVVHMAASLYSDTKGNAHYLSKPSNLLKHSTPPRPIDSIHRLDTNDETNSLNVQTTNLGFNQLRLMNISDSIDLSSF